MLVTTATIMERVRREFRDMPGLMLTLAQAGRLWSLDTHTCNEVLAQLVEAGFLGRDAAGVFRLKLDQGLKMPPISPASERNSRYP
jgi:DNA-binding IclR family transcriptional regulator